MILNSNLGSFSGRSMCFNLSILSILMGLGSNVSLSFSLNFNVFWCIWLGSLLCSLIGLSFLFVSLNCFLRSIFRIMMSLQFCFFGFVMKNLLTFCVSSSFSFFVGSLLRSRISLQLSFNQFLMSFSRRVDPMNSWSSF